VNRIFPEWPKRTIVHKSQDYCANKAFIAVIKASTAWGCDIWVQSCEKMAGLIA